MTFLDRIKETSTSTGTGTFTLGGAVLGYKVFSNGTYKYCIVNETESEWEVGEGTVTSGVLTRTTIEASSNGGAAVSFSAGTKYVFNTVSAAYVNSLVPYTGATASVNLGAYNITATNIIRAGGLATQFLKADGSIDSTTYMNRAVYDTDGNGVVDAAEKMQTIGRNSTGVTLYKGTIVYISGSTGNRPNFVKAQANSEATSAGTFGVVVSDIANNSDGYVATIGTLADLDTRTTATNPFTSVTLADGDTIYLDPSTAGYVTNVKPSSPNHIVYVGKVVRTSPTLGTIVYRIQNGYELNEIHDVSISSVANNDVLVYETATALWKNKSIATILGYTPADDSLVVHLAGAENITGVKTFQNALKTTTGNNLLNTGGGNTVIGYTADPASSGTYKLDVNGAININTGILNKKLYTDTSAGVQSLKIGTGYELYGTLHSAGGFTSFITTTGFASGWNIIIGTNTAQSLIVNATNVKSTYDLQALAGMSNVTGNGSMSTYFASPYEGFKPNTTNGWGFAIFNSANSPMMAVKNTGQMQLNGYTSTSVFTGTVAGLLGFDSSGNVITSAAGVTGSGTAGQVTYWSGTSAVTGSSNLVWDNTNGRLGIGTSSPSTLLHVSKNQNAQTAINISNSTAGTSSSVSLNLNSDGGGFSFAKNSSLASSYKISLANDAVFYNGTVGDISFLNDVVTGKIKFAAGASSTPQLTLTSAGRLLLGTTTENTFLLDINGTARVTGPIIGAGALAVGSGSIAFGTNATAGGNQHAVALGYDAQSSNAHAIAIGYSSRASANPSYAFGQAATASGTYSTAFSGATASGSHSFSVGNGALATASASITFGPNTYAYLGGQFVTSSGNMSYKGDSQFSLVTLNLNTNAVNSGVTYSFTGVRPSNNTFSSGVSQIWLVQAKIVFSVS